MNDPSAQQLLTAGLELKRQNRVSEAAELFRRACQAEPANTQALLQFGVCLGMMRQLPHAAAVFREAIRLDPQLAPAYTNLGRALLEMGQLDQAERACRASLALRGDDAMTLANLATIQVKQARHQEAVATARAALAQRPTLAAAHYALGLAMRALGRAAESLEALTTAARLDPQNVEARTALAVVQYMTGQAQQAEETIHAALAMAPASAEAQNAAGIILQAQGRVAEAIDHFRSAVELEPANALIGSNLLLALHYVDQPDPRAVFEQHVAWGKRHAQPRQPQTPRAFANCRDLNRRLRIGYISADFRFHSSAHFLRPILEHHDRQQVEVFCYSNVAAADEWTEQFSRMNVTWRGVATLSDQQLAARIATDTIDIAVDCSGHTSKHRLLALAMKPAPVQVTFLGYPDTTGVDAIDYRITDAIADPPGEADELHVEKLVRLEPTAWCYSAPPEAPPCNPEASDDAITFGSFTTLAKLTPRWAKVWAVILQRAPGSRLLLKTAGMGDAMMRRRVTELFTSHGIDASRIELLPRQPSAAAHLSTYNRVDIALDTFPYHGTTTTCEALHMGVPVVTRLGRTHVSRVSASLLSAVGLSELIAADDEQYVELTVALAGDREQRRELRATLRSRMQASPLMNAQAYVAGLEQAYKNMWRAWCS